ncbi:hypothetical protein VPNG_08425 [Cytospora leucostoma]|uniref:Uncharacterized protein n=1 Tax=Cytospora leucostoma TaxID=1230097 RepID=A0A423W650_9PEZI|nr:hypothetical protein VPNG_08425 [Cytospora leucostoma]
MPPQGAAVQHAVGSPQMSRGAFSPTTPGLQINEIPQNLVLQSSPTMMTYPASPMAQSVPSPQAYMPGLPSPQQYDYVNYPPPTPNMQNLQYRVPHTHQMAPMHQGTMHQQGFGGINPSPMSPGQSTPGVQYMTPLQFGPSRPDSTNLPRTPTRLQMNGMPMANWPRASSTIVPRPGQVIERSEHAHSHHDRKSLFMSLHQAQARSPDRTRLVVDCMEDKEERYYQSVRSFAIEPFRLEYYHPSLEFTVSPGQFSLLSKAKDVPPLDGRKPVLIARGYTNGSLRYRLRCCQVDVDKPIAMSDWVIKETSWPEHIFPHFNQEKLAVRRGTHHGKDLPVELTDFVTPGVNKLKVALTGATRKQQRAKHFYMAVETLETLSHSQVLQYVWANGLADREETLEKIRKRVNAVPEGDGIAVIDRTGTTTSDLSIDLTDPFSSLIFAVPARGATCTHMECFDLETWLTTRPPKQTIKCGHQKTCTCPKYVEPSDADKWKCPICTADARPKSLRIDSFLYDVRRQLEQLNKLETKSILVAADGTWRPVIEQVDDDDAGSDGDGPAARGPVTALRKQPSKSASAERVVEIIELD